MILKLQKPMAGDMSLALVYNKDRTIMARVPMKIRAIRQLFAKNGPKVFVDADIIDGEIVVNDVLGDQKW